MKIIVILFFFLLLFQDANSQIANNKRFVFGVNLLAGKSYLTSPKDEIDYFLSPLTITGDLFVQYNFTNRFNLRFGLGMEKFKYYLKGNSDNGAHILYYVASWNWIPESGQALTEDALITNSNYGNTTTPIRTTILSMRYDESRYLTIPVLGRFNTKQVGFNRFYVEGGVKPSLLRMQRSQLSLRDAYADDPSSSSYDEYLNEWVFNPGLNKWKIDGVIGIGVDRNFSKEMYLTIGAQYSMNLTPIHESENSRIYVTNNIYQFEDTFNQLIDNIDSRLYYQKFRQHNIRILIGFHF